MGDDDPRIEWGPGEWAERVEQLESALRELVEAAESFISAESGSAEMLRKAGHKARSILPPERRDSEPRCEVCGKAESEGDPGSDQCEKDGHVWPERRDSE